MASSLAAGNQSLESKLLRTLEAIETSLLNQNAARSGGVFANSSAFHDGAASKAFEQASRFAGTMAFHLERAVGGLTAFRSALNTVYDRLNDPQLKHLGRSTAGSLNKSHTGAFYSAPGGFIQAVGGGGIGGGASGGAAAGKLIPPLPPPPPGVGNAYGSYLRRVPDAADAHMGGTYHTNASVNRSRFETDLKTVHTSGQKAAASSMLAAARLQMAVDLLATAAVMQLQVSGAIGKMFETALQAGSPDAAVTLDKSFKLLFATIGKDLTPIAFEFAKRLQSVAKEWDALDESTKRSYFAVLRFVSMVDALVGALGVLGSAVSFIHRNFGEVNFGATKAQKEKFGEEPTFSGIGQYPFFGIQRALNNSDNPLANQVGIRAFNAVNWWQYLPSKALGLDNPDPAKAVAGVRSAKFGQGVKTESGGDDRVALGFQNTANAQFMGFDQVWRNIQLNLLGKDDLDAKILEQQMQSYDALLKIEANTRRGGGAPGVRMN